MSGKIKLLITTGVLLVLAGAGALFLPLLLGSTLNTAGDRGEFYAQAASIIGANASMPESSELTSSRGFSVNYDSSIVNARAQTTDEESTENYVFGEEFTGDELKETRPYSMFDFELKDIEQETGVFDVLSKVELSVMTNIRADWFVNRESLPEYAGKSKIDILVADTIKRRTATAPNYSASKVTDITIGDTSYKKVTISIAYRSLGENIPGPTTDIYMTVQNGRPYWVEMGLITERNKQQTVALEPIIAAIKYQTPTYPEQPASDTETYTPSSSSGLKLPKGTSYVPNPIDSETVLNVVAKNQPAVVRIGAILCVDANLSDRSGRTQLAIKSACTGGVGSGSIVSTDGYIATNGHVTDLSDREALTMWVHAMYNKGYSTGDFSDLESLLNYMADASIISQSQVASYINDIKRRDAVALAMLDQLFGLIPESLVKITDRRPSYAVQTSNEPVKLNGSLDGEWSFATTSTVLPAKYVDSNFDPHLDLSLGFGDASDVAILKMDGNNFPIVTIGSIDSVQEGAQLTALGYPAFVDGGLGTTQATTVPAVTQGNVLPDGIGKSGAYILIATTVPIAQGNSGGPAFDNNGLQIGLNTYGSIDCPDQQCFGSGIARDVADFKSLLDKNNISLNTNGSVNTNWIQAVDALERGDYKTATVKFSQVADEYPANYLASSLADFAKNRQGGADDTSESGFDSLLVVIASTMIVAGLVVVAVAIVNLRKPKALTTQAAPVVSYPANQSPSSVYPEPAPTSVYRPENDDFRNPPNPPHLQ